MAEADREIVVLPWGAAPAVTAAAARSTLPRPRRVASPLAIRPLCVMNDRGRASRFGGEILRLTEGGVDDAAFSPQITSAAGQPKAWRR